MATTTNRDRRLAEATAIRTSADALGNGVHIVYAGDHNFYDSDNSEPAFGKLTSAGNGQANDPISRVGRWHDDPIFADVHTQSPAVNSRYAGQIVGGMDDRFDFQLISSEVLDEEGFSYLAGSYHAFGNNGSTFNLDIDSANNTVTFPEVSSHSKSQILGALASVTDHLPVVADYQIPARMSVQVAAIPPTVIRGATVAVDVIVENIASALLPLGADELDYSLSVTGSLFGSTTGTDLALGGGALHHLLLDTSSSGIKSGIISVMSTSQQVSNGSFSLPISFQVLERCLSADFNEDGEVDVFDLASLRDSFGLTTGAQKAQGDADGDGDVDGSDFVKWQREVGAFPPSVSTVPEPNARILVLGALFLLARHKLTRPGFGPRFGA